MKRLLTLEEALALATQHGYPEKAVATIQSRFTSLGLSTSTTNSEELARIVDDRNSLLVRIANESERHTKSGLTTPFLSGDKAEGRWQKAEGIKD